MKSRARSWRRNITSVRAMPRSSSGTRNSSRRSSCSTSIKVFGGWKATHEKHFADGALFDRIYGGGSKPQMSFRQPSILPGFGLTLGFSTFFLSAIVLVPLAALVMKTATMGWSDFVRVVTDARALASYRLSFGASILAATLNSVFGFIIAWTLVRYEFPGRKIIDALIDMPFALPTAGVGHRVDGGVRGERLDRSAPRAVRHQSRVHLDRRGRGIDA